MIILIDGTVGAGKSTLTERISEVSGIKM